MSNINLILWTDKNTIEISSEFERSVYENDPYGCLLFVYGSEHGDDNGKWVRNSESILTFDTECIEDYVDIEAEKAWISFEYKGIKYRWDLTVDGDWFDTKIIDKLNALLKETGENRRFYTYSQDQNLLVVFQDGITINKLNNVTGCTFS